MAKWLDPSERCRELARREREIYGQQELPDLLEHMAEESARLRADAANIAAQRDHAIARAEAAWGQLAVMEADLAAFRANQHYRYIGADGKPVLARDLEDRLIAAEAELARIRAADRTSITVRTTEAAKMRKGQAI